MTPTEPGFKVNLAGIHILIIEDDEDGRLVLKEVLEYCGALVHLTKSAEDALGTLDEFLPSIIISDLALPGFDGFAFIRVLRRQGRDRGGLVPAIAISAHYEDFARPEALRLGFNDYLEKPLNLTRLCTTIVRLCRADEVPAETVTETR